MTSITITTSIAAPADICFDAALDVELHVESAAFSDERLVAPGRQSGRLQLGDVVCFEGRHFGLTQRFCARITELERPRRFVDEMVEGAFKWLRHVHLFEESGGSTTMRDTLDWESPLGLAGVAADKMFVAPHMRRFVARKQQALKHAIERRYRGA